MIYREYAPSPAMRRYVACYWSLVGAGRAAAPVFPDGRMEMVFHFGDRFFQDGRPQAAALWVGQMTGPVRIEPSGRVEVFGVRFRAAAASCFVAGVAEMRGRIVALEDAWGQAAGELRDRLAGAPDRAAAADAWLLRRIRREPDGFVEAWARALARGEEAAAPWSSRHARRRFVDCVGLGPKRFERIVRFQRALRMIDNAPLAEAAAAAGYADQAHLTREFREFTGVTPGAMAEQPALMIP